MEIQGKRGTLGPVATRALAKESSSLQLWPSSLAHRLTGSSGQSLERFKYEFYFIMITLLLCGE